MQAIHGSNSELIFFWKLEILWFDGAILILKCDQPRLQFHPHVTTKNKLNGWECAFLSGNFIFLRFFLFQLFLAQFAHHWLENRAFFSNFPTCLFTKFDDRTKISHCHGPLMVRNLNEHSYLRISLDFCQIRHLYFCPYQNKRCSS